MRAHFPSVDVDEAVAETLVALVDILADYRYDPKEKGRFHNYLTGILRHKALRLCRRAQRENALKSAWATEPVAAADDPEDEAYRQSLVEIALARFFSDISVASRTKGR